MHPVMNSFFRYKYVAVIAVIISFNIGKAQPSFLHISTLVDWTHDCFLKEKRIMDNSFKRNAQYKEQIIKKMYNFYISEIGAMPYLWTDIQLFQRHTRAKDMKYKTK